MDATAPPPNCLHCEQPVEDGALFCGHCGEPIPVVSPASDPFVNRVVSRNYRIVKRIAQGGMGVVYLARHEELGQRVAVKFLHRRFADDEELAARFFNEARSASKVAHPYAVGIFDFSRLDDGTLFIVMEYVDGTPLHDLIRERGPLDPALAVALTIKACQVLDVAHEQHLVHRDVKPDNIMVIEGRDGDPTIKVLDFGIAKILDEEASGGLTQTGMMFGTPEYMSPEQASGDVVDQRSDVYALGLVLYEMLVGHPPFQGRNKLALLQRHIREAPAPVERACSKPLPRSLSALIMRSLAKKPADRPQSMTEFAEALKAIEPELGRSTGRQTRAGSILTHDRTARAATGPGAEARDAAGVPETEYRLGGADDADEGFALGTGPLERGTDGYSLGADDGFDAPFDDGFDAEFDDDDLMAGERPGRGAPPVRRAAPLPVMVGVLLAIIGAAFAIRAIDQRAAGPSPDDALAGSGDGSAAEVLVAGAEESEASGEPAADAPPAAQAADAVAAAPDAGSPPAASRTEPTSPRTAPTPAPTPTGPDVGERVAAGEQALTEGRLDDARAAAAAALAAAPDDERAEALRRRLTALDVMRADVQRLLDDEECLRADEQVVAMREAYGTRVASRYYGALDDCRASQAPPATSPAPEPDPAPAPRAERPREDRRVLPPTEL